MKGKGGYKCPVIAPAPYKKEPEGAQSGDNTSPPQLKARGGAAKKRMDKKPRSGKWMSDLHIKKGAMTEAAEREGVSNSEYEQEHKNDSGLAGKRARLAITFKKAKK